MTFVVDHADAHAGDGLLERNLRDGQRGGGAGDRQDVGVVLCIGGQRSAMICVSYRQPDGKSGRIGRSISRLVRTSFSAALPSRLKNPPGIRPDAYAYSR